MLSLLLLPFLAGPPTCPPARDLDTVDLAAAIKPSVVVVHQVGRPGRDALGTGFVIDDGLIVTNQHVIGEGRALWIETSDGVRHDVTEVVAFDRKSDLAVLRIADASLPPLSLGDDATLRDGQGVVAIGTPKGLKSSVVAGVVSGRREVDGRNMIQVAIPIEPGNSGGPLVDRRGRVVGVMTIKSLVTDNLGFAMPVSAVRRLLVRPNPVPMRAWQTIGVLDPDEWQTRGGATWRQRSGRIRVEGAGEGFGGRSLCLSRRATPEGSFEVAVSVRLDDEAGAAGLAFHADGGDRHYGFYPSGGKLRLVCFQGADVFTWKVLGEKAVPAYRPGEFNRLRVRVEKGRIQTWVNDEPAFDHEDDTFTSGRVGLAKFRDTVAEFKHFALAKRLSAERPSAELTERIAKVVRELPLGTPNLDPARRLPDGKPLTLAALREQARLLEERAAQVRRLAQAAHQRETLAELTRVMAGREPDLIHAALLIAHLDNDELDVDAYREEYDRLARKALARIGKADSDAEKLRRLDAFLFREKGFHGSRSDYNNKANSYLSEVLDDREGLPITLSLLYLALARRAGVTVEGVGLPGHFLVRHGKGPMATYIDVFEGGTRLTQAEAAKKSASITGEELEADDPAWRAITPRRMLVRVVYNLFNLARKQDELPSMLRYAEAMVALDSEGAEERGLRSLLRLKAGDFRGAEADVDWILKARPEGIDLERVEQLKRFLMRKRSETEESR